MELNLFGEFKPYVMDLTANEWFRKVCFSNSKPHEIDGLAQILISLEVDHTGRTLLITTAGQPIPDSIHKHPKAHLVLDDDEMDSAFYYHSEVRECDDEFRPGLLLRGDTLLEWAAGVILAFRLCVHAEQSRMVKLFLDKEQAYEKALAEEDAA